MKEATHEDQYLVDSNYYVGFSSNRIWHCSTMLDIKRKKDTMTPSPEIMKKIKDYISSTEYGEITITIRGGKVKNISHTSSVQICDLTNEEICSKGESR